MIFFCEKNILIFTPQLTGLHTIYMYIVGEVHDCYIHSVDLGVRIIQKRIVCINCVIFLFVRFCVGDIIFVYAKLK